MGWIVNMNTGQPLSIVAQNMLYNNGTPDVVGPFDIRSGKAEFPSGPTGNYFSPSSIKLVRDPQCLAVAASLQSACTLNAVADAGGSQILLQHPKPGTRGTLGQRVVEGPGRWRFDASMGKSFKITEAKNLQFRVDARNVFNHPEPNPAALIMNINDANFGRFAGTNAKSETSFRELQASLRLNF